MWGNVCGEGNCCWVAKVGVEPGANERELLESCELWCGIPPAFDRGAEGCGDRDWGS